MHLGLHASGLAGACPATAAVSRSPSSEPSSLVVTLPTTRQRAIGHGTTLPSGRIAALPLPQPPHVSFGSAIVPLPKLRCRSKLTLFNPKDSSSAFASSVLSSAIIPLIIATRRGLISAMPR